MYVVCMYCIDCSSISSMIFGLGGSRWRPAAPGGSRGGARWLPCQRHGVVGVKQRRNVGGVVAGEVERGVELVHSVPGLGKKLLQNFLAMPVQVGTHPVMHDHREEPNPYKSRYPDDWEEQLAADLRTKGHVSVKELVTHMFERTREHYEALGVTDWMVYHDASIDGVEAPSSS